MGLAYCDSGVSPRARANCFCALSRALMLACALIRDPRWRQGHSCPRCGLWDREQTAGNYRAPWAGQVSRPRFASPLGAVTGARGPPRSVAARLPFPKQKQPLASRDLETGTRTAEAHLEETPTSTMARVPRT